MVSLSKEEHKFVFHLNESLLFETGQEIEDMKAISLEPDIVVQTYPDHIQIRGILFLEGEYVRKKDVTHDPQNVYHPALRYVEKVIEQDEHINYFSHRFPVEISVPLYRVADVEDIYASIAAFDYEIVTENKMNIVATLNIFGIDETASPTLKRERETEKQEQIEEMPAKKASLGMEDVEKDALEQVAPLEQVTEPSDNNIKHAKEEVHSEEHKTDKVQQTEPIAAEETQKKENRQHDDFVRNEPSTDHHFEAEELDIQLSEQENTEESDVADITFLSELFADEIEKYTQIKIYIAQENDTIESIAKRYEIPILKLLKANNLMEDTITSGQLIKITKDDGSQPF